MTKKQARAELKREIYYALDETDWTGDGRVSEEAGYEAMVEAQNAIMKAVDKYVASLR